VKVAKVIRVSYVEFKRTQTGPWELGVMVNDDKLIIDTDSRPVPEPVWSYQTKPDRGALELREL
jgi:hypothetical protein